MAGAMTSSSCSCATEMCSMADSMANGSVRTFRPVSAAKVSGRTNFLGGGGHDDLDLVAVLHQQAGQFSGLISRDPAADAEEDLHETNELQLWFDRRLGRLAGERVLHQAAAHLFGRDDGGLLRRSRQDRPGAALQLSRPLGGHDDETIGALLRIVRKRAVDIIAWGFIFGHAFDTSSTLKCLQNGPDLILDPGAADALGVNDRAQHPVRFAQVVD